MHIDNTLIVIPVGCIQRDCKNLYCTAFHVLVRYSAVLSITEPVGPTGPFGLKIFHTFCIELFLAPIEWGPLGFLFGYHCSIVHFTIQYTVHCTVTVQVQYYRYIRTVYCSNAICEYLKLHSPYSSLKAYLSYLLFLVSITSTVRCLCNNCNQPTCMSLMGGVTIEPSETWASPDF